jgi:threonine/homoserine/homoserine lactone efflux protein
MSAFLSGLAMGFSIAVPVGPIGLLCLRRSVTEGRLAGLVTGLGAATADTIYGAVAAAGLTAVTSALVAHRAALQFAGGLFLLYLGVTTFRAKPAAPLVLGAPRSTSLAAAYGSTLLLTLANPLTILAFVGIFAGLGLRPGLGEASWLVLGVAVGSAVWWLALSAVASRLRTRLQGGGLRGLNLCSGLAIGGFGLWQLAGSLRSLR